MCGEFGTMPGFDVQVDLSEMMRFMLADVELFTLVSLLTDAWKSGAQIKQVVSIINTHDKGSSKVVSEPSGGSDAGESAVEGRVNHDDVILHLAEIADTKIDGASSVNMRSLRCAATKPGHGCVPVFSKFCDALNGPRCEHSG